MEPGDIIWVRVFKSDGQPHRWWQARVESADDECIILYADPPNPVYHNPQRFPRDLYVQEHIFRSFYWPGRRHNLLEVYATDGQLLELYADIISPIDVGPDEIRFIDHELDVSRLSGQEPRVVDQDEFAEAAMLYGYTDAFVSEAYNLAEQLRDLLVNWQPTGIKSTP